VLTPILATILVPLYIWQNGFNWWYLALFAIAFSFSNMSITSGYHRYFSHRSYDTHPAVAWLYLFVASGAFQGSALQWSTDHRRHHLEVDTEGDPYSINKGFWFAHVIWMFREDPHPQARNYAQDLNQNHWIRLQHRYYLWIASFVGFVIPGLAAWACGLDFWGGVLFGGLLRIVCTQHSTFLINSAAHKFGRQTYTDKYTARDNLILAFFTFGEGYHNFHHSFQADYRNGLHWYQWDPTKWWIEILALVGLARRLKRARIEDIMKARLAMEERLLVARGASSERVTQLKLRVEEAQKTLRSLRDSYQLAKDDFNTRSRNWKRMMRAEIRMAEIEFRSAYCQWRTFQRAI